MEDELFFVGIRDPVELRKELLTSSKNLIDSLRRYEMYKQLKEEKQQHILQLKRVFDEMLVLNRKLRGHLPRIPVKVPALARDEKPAKMPKTTIKMKTVAKSKIDVLEEELSKIEERLENLE